MRCTRPYGRVRIETHALAKKMAQRLRHFRRGATARQLGDLRRAKKRNCATLAETYGYAKPNDWRSRRAGRFGQCVAVCKPCTTRCGTDGCTLQSTRDLQSVQELQVLQALLQRRWHLLRVPLTPAQDSTSTQRVCACASPTHTAIACAHPLFAPPHRCMRSTEPHSCRNVLWYETP
jgi:hypothetical protein